MTCQSVLDAAKQKTTLVAETPVDGGVNASGTSCSPTGVSAVSSLDVGLANLGHKYREAKVRSRHRKEGTQKRLSKGEEGRSQSSSSGNCQLDQQYIFCQKGGTQ